jgi:hypothetical protein
MLIVCASLVLLQNPPLPATRAVQGPPWKRLTHAQATRPLVTEDGRFVFTNYPSLVPYDLSTGWPGPAEATHRLTKTGDVVTGSQVGFLLKRDRTVAQTRTWVYPLWARSAGLLIGGVSRKGGCEVARLDFAARGPRPNVKLILPVRATTECLTISYRGAENAGDVLTLARASTESQYAFRAFHVDWRSRAIKPISVKRFGVPARARIPAWIGKGVKPMVGLLELSASGRFAYVPLMRDLGGTFAGTVEINLATQETTHLPNLPAPYHVGRRLYVGNDLLVSGTMPSSGPTSGDRSLPAMRLFRFNRTNKTWTALGDYSILGANSDCRILTLLDTKGATLTLWLKPSSN